MNKNKQELLKQLEITILSISIKIAAELYSVPAHVFYYGIRNKQLPYTRKGQAYFLHEKDIVKFLTKKRIRKQQHVYLCEKKEYK